MPQPARVVRGTALALAAVPAGAVVSGLVWKLGFVASISGVVTALLAAVLYVRGAGSPARGVPVVIAVTALGAAVNFFTIVAVDLWGYYDQLDPAMASVFGSRWAFIAGSLFYPTLLRQYVRQALFFALFGVLGGLFAVVRLVRLGRAR